MKNLPRIALLFLGAALTLSAADRTFDFEVLQFRAKAIAAQPYTAPPSHVPDWLLNLDYDQLRDIRFDEARAIWRAEKLPYQLQFFHLGRGFKNPIQIHELIQKEEKLIEFSPKLFDYGRNKVSGRVPANMGFAGFRILTTLNSQAHLDELASFLGASYFRVLGLGMSYGLSARGLAINTAEAGGEEFPVFDDFWVERPLPGAKSITVFALLNSPSVAGAYRFIITPGAATVMQVKATLYCRKNPVMLGIAPLTSMFAHGENTGWSQHDFRPEVHDSDGLLVQTGAGEWLWRPLLNPAQVRVVSFADSNPHGFGLLQRDRDFAHYDDLEAHYHQRPSVWVEPVGQWGRGVVRLVEIPTPDETNDNIVACWVPSQLPPEGEPINFEYRLHWMMEPGERPPAGYVHSTRQGAVLSHPEQRRFVIEFTGPKLEKLPENSQCAGVVTIGEGAKLVSESVTQKNSYTGTWRVAFVVQPDGTNRPVEMRCFLRTKQNVLTETWSYLWNP